MERKEKKWCVYIHINKINNKSYIGIAKGDPKQRWKKNGDGYKNHQQVFYRAIQKYGWDNFEHIIWIDNLSQEEAKLWEIRLIALFKTNCCRYTDPMLGYNMTDGGEGTYGYKHSEEIKKRISDAHTNPSEETRKKMSESKKGRSLSEETRRKMSEVKKGKSFSEEHKKNMGRAHKGIKWDDDRRRKISGENHPNYGKGKGVVQISIEGEYIAEYISSDEAEKITGINCNGIRLCCNHKPHRHTAGGFIWMYKDEYLEQYKIKGDLKNGKSVYVCWKDHAYEGNRKVCSN